jgi:hypothetical protein
MNGKIYSSEYLQGAFLLVVTNAIDPGSRSIVFVLLTSYACHLFVFVSFPDPYLRSYNPDILVSIMTGYRLDGRGSIRGRCKGIFSTP